jgi:hypothetical protein
MACVVAGARWQRGTICAHLPSGPLVGEFFVVSLDGGELWRTMAISETRSSTKTSSPNLARQLLSVRLPLQ